ncbi:hypothetical protein PHMEG_0002674 [Phytophthora megakarya]|uniref:Uncharacterized protein n=1 Tax=Phytophthora megakarya TaxID=4795 RepID=A0A225WY39_9STRA|nr:hypothetical protein PHMEG_0002674 [Phytophthora megakarya]
MSKLRLPKLKLPDESSTGKSSTPTPSPKQVVYVRLRRCERANQVVLSSAEKYSFAKAMVEPLLNHLSSLGREDTEFYEELQAWKSTVEEGLRVGESREKADEVLNPEGADDDDELYQRVNSTIDPVDAMATVNQMEVFENQNIEDVTDGISSGDDIPLTQLAVSGPDDRTAPQSEKKDEASTTRQVDVINVPKPKRRTQSRSTRSALTQLRQSKFTSARLAVHKYPTGLTVKLDELITWARNTPNVKHVLTTLEKYPVQLTDAYLRSRVIECQWEVMRTADNMHPFRYSC